MLVIADTTPINHLVLIGHIEILPKIYSRILVSPAVIAELQHESAPQIVRQWASHTPAWLESVAPKPRNLFARLDRGESDAIVLALEMHADLLRIDGAPVEKKR